MVTVKKIWNYLIMDGFNFIVEAVEAHPRIAAGGLLICFSVELYRLIF
jgi:hypothetical protein